MLQCPCPVSDRPCASVRAAYEESSEGCAPAVEGLVSRLPDHHGATLRLVMRHVCRLSQMQQARGHRYPPTQLLGSLSFVLIRPPYDQLT